MLRVYYFLTNRNNLFERPNITCCYTTLSIYIWQKFSFFHQKKDEFRKFTKTKLRYRDDNYRKFEVSQTTEFQRSVKHQSKKYSFQRNPFDVSINGLFSLTRSLFQCCSFVNYINLKKVLRYTLFRAYGTYGTCKETLSILFKPTEWRIVLKRKPPFVIFMYYSDYVDNRKEIT